MGAFENCPELTDVYCYATNLPTIYTNAFNDSYIEYANLHVPSELIDAYSMEEPWKNFKSIIALTDNDPKPSAITNIYYDHNKQTDIFYSLKGQRVTNPTNGLYINNGKIYMK
jgi:hypothetical protein